MGTLGYNIQISLKKCPTLRNFSVKFGRCNLEFGIPRVYRITLCIWFPHNMTCLALSGLKTHRGAGGGGHGANWGRRDGRRGSVRVVSPLKGRRCKRHSSTSVDARGADASLRVAAKIRRFQFIHHDMTKNTKTRFLDNREYVLNANGPILLPVLFTVIIEVLRPSKFLGSSLISI